MILYVDNCNVRFYHLLCHFLKKCNNCSMTELWVTSCNFAYLCFTGIESACGRSHVYFYFSKYFIHLNVGFCACTVNMCGTRFRPVLWHTCMCVVVITDYTLTNLVHITCTTTSYFQLCACWLFRRHDN